ncbi:MAG: glycosyltransferase, partial [Thermoprotei archaeon]
NALLCPIRDSRCLYEKVVYLLDNEEKRLQLARKGMETAQQFSYKRKEEDFLRLMEAEGFLPSHEQVVGSV